MAMFMRSLLLAGLLFVGSNAGSTEASTLVNQTFSGYMKAFGKNYGSAEHSMREEIFTQRKAEILAHNAGGHSWKMGLNEFTDHTDSELKRMLGYKRPHKGDSVMGGSSVMQLANDDSSCGTKAQSCGSAKSCCGSFICGSSGTCEEPAGSTEAMDWSSIPGSMEIYNQGGCGSCWAVAAAVTVQLQAAKMNPKFNKILSPQNVNQCAPNPHSCGGEGGCEGSTPELAFEYLKSLSSSKGGLLTMDGLPYTASSTQPIPMASCAAASASSSSFLQIKDHRDQNLRSRPVIETPAVTMGDFTRVKDNHAEQVMNSLVSVGPLTVAVVGSGIQGYDGGVLSNCKSAVVDHAVVMMGFGKDAPTQLLYWNIRNSWGKNWGEKGFFRLKRNYKKGTKTTGDPMTDNKFHGEPCGWDMDPAKGVACKDAKGNYPEKTRVCGECGIVSDVLYPTSITVDPKLLV